MFYNYACKERGENHYEYKIHIIVVYLYTTKEKTVQIKTWKQLQYYHISNTISINNLYEQLLENNIIPN